MLESITLWLENTWLSSAFLSNAQWAWPLSESLHFIGLCFLVGTVGLVDLRMLGLAKAIPFTAIHKLIPWGIGGFCVNVVTGSLFFTGTPDQYIFNPAFRFKLLFLTCAALNVGVFYATVFPQLKTLGPYQDAPVKAKVMASISLACWIGVICAGRLLTFYRP